MTHSDRGNLEMKVLAAAHQKKRPRAIARKGQGCSLAQTQRCPPVDGAQVGDGGRTCAVTGLAEEQLLTVTGELPELRPVLPRQIAPFGVPSLADDDARPVRV